MNLRGVGRGVVLRWPLVAPASVALGLLLEHWEVPAGWILAGIVSAGAAALISGTELPVNRTVYTFGAGVVGVLAGVPLAAEPLGQVLGYLPPGIAVAAATIGLGFAAGLILARMQPSISSTTGILSMLAGGASFMPAIAKEIGADMRYVALTQYLRLLTVALSLPLVTALVVGPTPDAAPAADEIPQTWWMVALIIAIALVGGPVAKIIRLPAPSVLGPLLLAVALSLALPDLVNLRPPEPLRALAFLSIGWLAGGTLSMTALKTFARQLPLTMLLIGAIMGISAVVAIPISAWVGISYFDAYLATSPGAIDTVLAISSEISADPGVVAIQLTRLILILVVAASLPKILGRFRKEHPEP